MPEVYQVLWFGSGATCTLMCMLYVLVVVHYLTCQVAMVNTIMC